MLKARDDLLKNECDRQGSTTVTILIPLCKEIAKFQHSCWTTLKDSKMEPKQRDLLYAIFDYDGNDKIWGSTVCRDQRLEEN